MASTTGTALGTMQLSCLPLTERSTFLPVLRSTVLWLLPMDAVGLKATRATMGMPLLKPPETPPALLVSVTNFLPLRLKRSLCSEPCMAAAANPAPNSTPRAAGMAKKALDSSPSSVSKTGSPSPPGTLKASTSTVPPMLSARFCTSFISCSIPAAAALSAHLTGLLYIFSRVISAGWGVAFMSPICTVWAVISMPDRDSSLRAMAPAMTKPAVIRPENLPPPRKSLYLPYLRKAV